MPKEPTNDPIKNLSRGPNANKDSSSATGSTSSTGSTGSSATSSTDLSQEDYANLTGIKSEQGRKQIFVTGENQPLGSPDTIKKGDRIARQHFGGSWSKMVSYFIDQAEL